MTLPLIYSISEWDEQIIRCKGGFTNAAFQCRALFTVGNVDGCIFIHYNTMNVDYENKVS